MQSSLAGFVKRSVKPEKRQLSATGEDSSTVTSDPKDPDLALALAASLEEGSCAFPQEVDTGAPSTSGREATAAAPADAQSSPSGREPTGLWQIVYVSAFPEHAKELLWRGLSSNNLLITDKPDCWKETHDGYQLKGII